MHKLIVGADEAHANNSIAASLGAGVVDARTHTCVVMI